MDVVRKFYAKLDGYVAALLGINLAFSYSTNTSTIGEKVALLGAIGAVGEDLADKGCKGTFIAAGGMGISGLERIFSPDPSQYLRAVVDFSAGGVLIIHGVGKYIDLIPQ